jgi:hypothetical protein
VNEFINESASSSDPLPVCQLCPPVLRDLTFAYPRLLQPWPHDTCICAVPGMNQVVPEDTELDPSGNVCHSRITPTVRGFWRKFVCRYLCVLVWQVDINEREQRQCSVHTACLEEMGAAAAARRVKHWENLRIHKQTAGRQCQCIQLPTSLPCEHLPIAHAPSNYTERT